MNLSSFSIEDFQFTNYTECSNNFLLEILNHRNSTGISRWMKTTANISPQQHFAFVENLRFAKDKIYFAVSKGNQYIGSIYLIKNFDGLWERGLYIIPNYQGQGYATLMEKYFLANLREMGICQIVAEVFKNNHNSLKFHERMGYKKMTETDKSIKFSLEVKK